MATTTTMKITALFEGKLRMLVIRFAGYIDDEFLFPVVFKDFRPTVGDAFALFDRFRNIKRRETLVLAITTPRLFLETYVWSSVMESRDSVFSLFLSKNMYIQIYTTPAI